MLYFLDTANAQDIRHCNEYYPVSGVTTNPSIIAREKKDFWTLVKEIRDIIGPDKLFFAQTVQSTADKIVQEAQVLNEKSGGAFCIKIPICEEGLKATAQLKAIGIPVLMTAIFTPAQALVAAKSGADFVAPYVNRLDNIIADGTNVVAEIVKQFKQYQLSCQVLAASFQTAEQVHKCAAAGCHSVTVSADILKAVINYPMTDSAIRNFSADWQSVYGNKTILDF